MCSRVSTVSTNRCFGIAGDAFVLAFICGRHNGRYIGCDASRDYLQLQSVWDVAANCPASQRQHRMRLGSRSYSPKYTVSLRHDAVVRWAGMLSRHKGARRVLWRKETALDWVACVTNHKDFFPLWRHLALPLSNGLKCQDVEDPSLLPKPLLPKNQLGQSTIHDINNERRLFVPPPVTCEFFSRSSHKI